jgi:hypothetical protein
VPVLLKLVVTIVQSKGLQGNYEKPVDGPDSDSDSDPDSDSESVTSELAENDISYVSDDEYWDFPKMRAIDEGLGSPQMCALL